MLRPTSLRSILPRLPPPTCTRSPWRAMPRTPQGPSSRPGTGCGGGDGSLGAEGRCRCGSGRGRRPRVRCRCRFHRPRRFRRRGFRRGVARHVRGRPPARVGPQDRGGGRGGRRHELRQQHGLRRAGGRVPQCLTEGAARGLRRFEIRIFRRGSARNYFCCRSLALTPVFSCR